MTIHAKNFIAGEWVEARDMAPDLNPSNTDDVVGQFPRASAADARTRDRRGEGRIPGLVALLDPGAPRHPEEDRRRDSRAQGRARTAALARGGQDARRRHRRDRARGADLPVLLRRMPAARGREGALGASGRRCRDHARADRRCRPHHAVEFPDRDSGLEDRAGARLRQLRRVQAGRPRAGDRACARPRSSPRPACRRACSISSWAAARWSARRSSKSKDVAAVSFTGSVATGRKLAATCIESDPMKKVQLEMGGKNPFVVLDDADLKMAVECTVNGAFFSTGQRCTASSRVIVTERHPRQVRRRADRAHEVAGDRRCAEGRARRSARSSTRASSTRTSPISRSAATRARR